MAFDTQYWIKYDIQVVVIFKNEIHKIETYYVINNQENCYYKTLLDVSYRVTNVYVRILYIFIGIQLLRRVSLELLSYHPTHAIGC